MRLRLFISLFALLALLTLPGSADAQAVTLRATLSGKTVVPDGGDPDGAGTASLTIDPAKRQVCYEVSVSEIVRLVVPLSAPKDGVAKGCSSELDAATLRAIIENPAGYYVNVHTSSYRAGALRGQLSS